ncbi:MAG TPA: hypothetical protein VJ305_25975 [Streptosporangiaceae bacterium]|nr:hypothetical protein [Streptosporangiaceae bacterium]
MGDVSGGHAGDYGVGEAAELGELAGQRTGTGRGQGHRYTLADFGLTGAEVDERFAVIPGREPSKR